jgi:hypothetical protein
MIKPAVHHGGQRCMTIWKRLIDAADHEYPYSRKLNAFEENGMTINESMKRQRYFVDCSSKNDKAFTSIG